MPDATAAHAVTYEPTGQPLVRLRAPAAKPTLWPPQARHARLSVPSPCTHDLVAAWLMQVEAVRAQRKFGAAPNAADLAKAREDLREAGEALIARIRQSFADAVQ